jgi:hypothetical protein
VSHGALSTVESENGREGHARRVAMERPTRRSVVTTRAAWMLVSGSGVGGVGMLWVRAEVSSGNLVTATTTAP